MQLFFLFISFYNKKHCSNDIKTEIFQLVHKIYVESNHFK